MLEPLPANQMALINQIIEKWSEYNLNWIRKRLLIEERKILKTAGKCRRAEKRPLK